MSQTTWDIFHFLLSSSAFCPANSSVLTKYEIFHDFWMKEVNWLRSQYDERGETVDGSGNKGFGFLVEEFARRSRILPFCNTEGGQRVATAILTALQEGDSDAVQLGRSRSNSDLIWVRQTGQRTTVVGMGEVKSSYEAFQKNTTQLVRQETALKLVAEKMSGRHTHQFFRNKKIKLSDNLTRVLIVPYGEKDRFKYVPNGWQVIEIEFSHNELVFISKLIWSRVWPNISFNNNEVHSFQTFMNDYFISFVRPKLNDILATEVVSCWELGLFTWSTSKLPILEEDQQLAVNMIQHLYWEALEQALRNPIKFEELGEQECRFYNRFSTGNNPSTILMYLSFARQIGTRVKEEARKVDKTRVIKNMLDINLLEL